MAMDLSLTGFCSDCGKNLALVGRSHICRPGTRKVIAGERLESGDVVVIANDVASKPKRGRPRKTEAGFDKAAWQRDYMRKRRAEGKK